MTAIKPLYDEQALLVKTAAADPHAFAQLYERHKKKVYTYAITLLHNEEDAEEIMQEVFLKLWRMGSSLLEINNLEAFLKTMARNRSLDAMRKLLASDKSEKLLIQNFTEAHNETEEAILLKETREVINKAISLLPQQQQEVYRLCHQDGLKYEEVANRLQISVNTVKTHMKRALQTLREQLGTHSDIVAILILFKIF